MNKHLKVSLTLTALSLTTIGLLTSCSASSDLDGLIEQNRVQLQGELRDAIKKAEQELNAAKTEIKALIDSGDKTNADELAKKIAELQESIELAKKTAASGDTAATAALEQKIEEAKNFVSEACAEGLHKARAEFDEMFATQDGALRGYMDEKVAELSSTIELVKNVAEASDAQLKEELMAAVEAVQTDAIQLIESVLQEETAALRVQITEENLMLSDELDQKIVSLNSAIEALQILSEESDEAIRFEVAEAINQAKQETTNAIAQSMNMLSEELTAKIEAGDAASTESIRALIDEMNQSIEAAKKLANDNDAILKDELLIQITVLRADLGFAMEDALELVKSEMKAAMEAGDLANAEAYSAEIANLVAMVAGIEELVAEEDAAVRAELLEAIEATKQALTADLLAKAKELTADFDAKVEATNGNLASAVEQFNATEAALRSLIDEKDAAVYEELDALKVAFAEDLRKAIDDAKAELRGEHEAELIKTASEMAALLDAAKEFATAGDDAVRHDLEIAILNAESSMKVYVKAEIQAALEAFKGELSGDIANLEATMTRVEELLVGMETLENYYKDLGALIETTRQSILNEVQGKIDALAEEMAAQREEILEIVAGGDEQNAEALKEAKAQLEKLIKECQDKISVLANQDSEFHGKIQGIYDELTASIAATRTASMQLADWNAATDDLVQDDGGLDRLKDIFESYEAKKSTYVDGDFVKVEELYADYWVRMIRATSTEDVERLLVAFDTDAAKVRTWPDAIYDALMDVGSSVEEVEYDADGVKLDYVASLLAQAHALNNPDVDAAILAYGEDGVNLEELYATYKAQYISLLKQSNGQGIKDRMDALIGQPVIWTDSNEADSLKMLLLSIRAEYDGWIADPANALENVEGFAETYAQFVAIEERFAALCNAKAEADEINKLIPDYLAGVEANGATWINDHNVNSLKDKAASWIAMYFSGDYALEVENGSANYNLLDHAALAELVDTFDAKVAAFKEEAQKFADAVDAIGEVNLLSWDEINTALGQYGELVLSRDLNDFEYLFDEDGSSPAMYYEILVDKYGEYRILKNSAYNDYVSAYSQVNGLLVTIYDGTKVNGMMAWYDTYGVKDENGAIVFDNGESGSGYVLGNGLVVDAAQYEVAAQMKFDYDLLVSAKNLEIEALKTAIDAIGTVTYGKRDYIASVRNAYNNYLTGANMPGEYFTAEQFAINTELPGYEVSNAETLVLAEELLADLVKQVKNIKDFIATHADYTGYTSFESQAARDSYDKRTSVIESMLEKFYVENNYSYDDAFTQEELDKVHTSRLAVHKYDRTVEMLQYIRKNVRSAFDKTFEDAIGVYNAQESHRWHMLFLQT